MFIIRKKINGNNYYYLCHSFRYKNNVIRKNLLYLGKARDVRDNLGIFLDSIQEKITDIENELEEKK